MDGHGLSWFRGPMLGKGSYGSVFMATVKKPKFNTTLFPTVMAVKSAKLSASASLQKEKEILDDLRGCPFVLDCSGEEITTDGNGEKVYNLLIEYASGGTLGDEIDQWKGCGLPERDVRHFTRCILEGLSHIHDRGYVHCDLKPDNILLVPIEGGKVVAKIGDLGLSKRARESKKQRLDRGWRGTPLYLAPETVVDHLQESPSDIWALGCVVLEMLTGRKAWGVKQNRSIHQLLHEIGKENSIPEIPSWISEEGKDFLNQCFMRIPMFRLTAERLLTNHPYVQGLNEEIFRELKGKCCSDGELSLPDTVSECRSSVLCSDCSEEDNRSSFSSRESICGSVEKVAAASGIQKRSLCKAGGSAITVDA